MSEHVAAQCTQCGQVDTHPKSHWEDGESYHFDCLPFRKREVFIASHPLAESLVKAATEGTHGEDLRAFSSKLHEDHANAVNAHFSGQEG